MKKAQEKCFQRLPTPLKRIYGVLKAENQKPCARIIKNAIREIIKQSNRVSGKLTKDVSKQILDKIK